MKNKKWIILLIIAFPSLFWLILETSTINSRKLPHYGPKKVIAAGDTLYYQVPATPEIMSHAQVFCFLHPAHRSEAYRLAGFWEFEKYKKDKISEIPFHFIYPQAHDNIKVPEELRDLLILPGIRFESLNEAQYQAMREAYFRGKPYYIDPGFFVLIDGNQHIRGYYDMRYASEMKRLVEEYRHLRLKEEKQKLIQDNEIKSRS
ncbi:MAG TPA: hypothetical protein PLQ93_09950 [Bacteroidia bacterium]|nr:hypothetical protein [Bacteroidia bacterium]